MAKGKSDQKSGKGIPTKARSDSRHRRQAACRARQPEHKLRHILARRRGVTPPAKVREAFEWADSHNELALLRRLRPEFQAELAAIGQPEA